MPISERPEQTLTDEDIQHLFTYHPPRPDQIGRFEAIKEACVSFAGTIRDNVRPGPDRTLAIRALMRLRMDANLAIALED